MAKVGMLSFTLLFAVLFLQQCICTDPPASSPTPAPESGADVASPPVTPAPSPSSNLTSPPAPPPSDLPTAPSPGNAGNAKESPSPAPVPNSEVASDINHESAEESKESSSGGMTSGRKAGIAVGVIAAVCFVGLGALVYKKRQQNIQRSQFGGSNNKIYGHELVEENLRTNGPN